MKYYPPLGAEDDNADYENCDPVNHKWENSMPDARGFGATQREIINAITAAGLEPTEDDNGQLAAAIQKWCRAAFDTSRFINACEPLKTALLRLKTKKSSAGRPFLQKQLSALIHRHAAKMQLMMS